ncbi:monooxygenase [Micromonospora sp. KC606]|uniref:monooxygenase n=1 Tax=Micromonospora sp. KC606 TaxID=2530379 RepID=UPI001FB7043E|nr:monooxygenase [Micromonospora sp. KC606]
MRRATGIGGRLVLAATVLAVVATSVACGGDTADPASPAPSSGSTHHGHGQSASPSPAPLRAGERFVTLTMPQPYSPVAPNDGTDEYRCFLVDPKLSATAYLTGSQFLPQNADIVHHAIFFQIAPADVQQAREADARTPGEGWQCFGDSGIDGGAWVAHWAPGANEVLLDPGLGYEMPPGAQLVMQVHYNLLATNRKSGSTDQSSIRLRLADDSTPTTALDTLQLPAPVELPCTAQESGPLCDRDAAIQDVTRRFGEAVGDNAEQLVQRCGKGKPVPGATQHCDYPVEDAATIYAAAGHMHLLGRSIKIELNPGAAGASTLLNVPQYNFDDQAIRPLATPIKIKKGDVIRVTCTHDASLRKMLPQLQHLPPRYVVWGDGTADEMCLGLLIGTRS